VPAVFEAATGFDLSPFLTFENPGLFGAYQQG
jgi:hypothetical protein